MSAAAERVQEIAEESEELRRARRRELAERARRAKRSYPDPAAFDDKDPRMIEARRRHLILQFGHGISGGAPARLRRINSSIESDRGELHDCGPVPSLSTYQRWERRYRAAGRSIAGLIDTPPVGCTPRDIRGKTAKRLLTLIFGRGAKYRVGREGRTPWKKITRALERWCSANGAPLPTVYSVRRFVRSVPKSKRFMAEFGTKATRARRSPKSTNPTRSALELFFVDETMLPTWIKVWHRTERRWYAARAWAVFVLDAHTRAIVAWWVKEPSALSASRRLHSHFTAQEIIATVAGAIDPSWADPDLRNFARGEPGEIRLDGSGNTKSAAKQLENKQFNTSVGEPYASWARGPMEHYFSTLKERDLNDLLGDDDLHLPFDPDREDPRTTRDRNSGDVHKMEPYRFEMPIESLGETRHLVSAVRQAVRSYNDTPHRGLNFVTPLSLFERTAPRLAMTSSSLFGLFKGHKLTVDPRGVEVQNVWYQSLVLQEEYAPGTEVFVRSDPLERGVLVYPERMSARARTPALFVGRRDAFARSMTPEVFNRTVKEDLAEMRAEINTAREELRDEDLGKEAANQFRADITDRSQSQDAKSRRGRSKAKASAADSSSEKDTAEQKARKGEAKRKAKGKTRRKAGMRSPIPSPTELRAQADAPTHDSVSRRRQRLSDSGKAAKKSADDVGGGLVNDLENDVHVTDDGATKSRRPPVADQPPAAAPDRNGATVRRKPPSDLFHLGLLRDKTRAAS